MVSIGTINGENSDIKYDLLAFFALFGNLYVTLQHNFSKGIRKLVKYLGYAKYHWSCRGNECPEEVYGI